MFLESFLLKTSAELESKMAEPSEGMLCQMLAECTAHGKKKGGRPARHKREKRRVEQREKMIVEKEAKRDAEREAMAQFEKQMAKSIGSIKDEQNRFFATYWHFKVVQRFLPDEHLTIGKAKDLDS